MKVQQVLIRICVNDIDQAVSFYEKLLGEKCTVKFEHPQLHLELAQVGSLFLIGGSNEVLESFRATKFTFLVDSVEEFKKFILDSGGSILKDVWETPMGINMVVKHADGTAVEYVQQRSQPEY